jgi:pilus assembly protein CpaF
MNKKIIKQNPSLETSVRKNLIPFQNLLAQTQEYLSEHYALTLYDANKADMVKQYIKQFMKDRNYYVEGEVLADVAERLYVEMAEYSFLTPYLQRTDIEELNINAWNDIAVHPCNGKPYKLKEHFSSPQHAIDIMRRLLHNNKLVFDESNG